MSRRRKSKMGESLKDNSYTYHLYLDRLIELSVSMFDWVNLPEEIDERFLETILFYDGKIVFFKDEELDQFVVLQFTTQGKLNFYRVPLLRRAFSNYNGYQRKLNENNSVIIYNNMIRTNSVLPCTFYAKKIYNLDRACEVNANAQKTPILIQCSESERLTMLNMYEQYDGNEPVIFGTKGMDVNALKVLKTDAPYVADKLYTLKTSYWNEALTYLGISNLNIQKKERLVSDEVTRNLGGTIASRYSRLETRRKAAEQINKMFGLNIEVNYREDFREMDDETMFTGQTGTGELADTVFDIRTK